MKPFKADLVWTNQCRTTDRNARFHPWFPDELRYCDAPDPGNPVEQLGGRLHLPELLHPPV